MGTKKAQLLLCYLLFFGSILLLSECAISPKYRSNPYPGVRSSSSPAEIPDNLINAKSINTLYGTASWYGPNFHGKLTANGEIFDMRAISAAHKDFPFGTWLRVTNLKNNHIINVRVNDRGPFVAGRIIDLSKKAAEELDFVIDGLAEVKIEVVYWGDNK